MTNPVTNPTPAAAADARERSFRSLLQGLGIDVATALVLALSVLLTTTEWTKAFWVTLAYSVGKSVVQATVSYFMRLLVKPKAPQEA